MVFSNPVSGIEQIKNYIFVSNTKIIYRGGFLFMANKLVLQKLFGDEKKRFIILTDMENEPDDSQTMVKLLLYSNEIDIEGLIAVTSCWLKDDVYPESIVSRIQAFGIVRANLMKHASGWPTTDYLLSITGGGQAGFGMEAVGEGKSTRGSEIIIQALLKEDPRPVYFSINAGANTLAQALYDMRNRLDKDILQVCLSKIRVFDDSGQDNAGAWINQEFPEVFYVRNSPQVYSLNGPDLNMGPQPWKPLNQFEWAEENVRKRHGILGELFPQRIMSLKGTGVPAGVVMLMYWFMDGGGTTGVLYVLNNGLNVPSEITWGGWGGRFRDKKRKIFAGESDSGESDLRQILEAPFLARRQYSGTMKEALGSLKYFGIEEEDLNIIATFDSAEMLRDCVEAGMGISILSYQMIRELHESGKILIYRLPEKEFCRELYLIYKNESFLPEIVKKFIHYTEKCFKKEF